MFDVLSNLDLQLSSKLLAPRDPSSKSFRNEHQQKPSFQGQSFVSFFLATASRIKTVVNTMVKAVSTVETAIIDVIDLTDGNFDKEFEETLASYQWNYNVDTQQASSNPMQLSNGILCRQCYAYTALEISVVIQITQRVLQNLKILLIGDFKFSVGLDVSSSISAQQEFLVAKLDFPSMTLPIAGFPLVVSPTLDVYFGLAVQGTVSTTFQGHCSAFIHGEIGVQYSEGKISTVKNFTHTFDTQFSKFPRASGLAVSPYVRPVLILLLKKLEDQQ